MTKIEAQAAVALICGALRLSGESGAAEQLAAAVEALSSPGEDVARRQRVWDVAFASAPSGGNSCAYAEHILGMWDLAQKALARPLDASRPAR